jgi:hypothetical protein
MKYTIAMNDAGADEWSSRRVRSSTDSRGDLRVIAPIRRSIPFRQSGRVDVLSTSPELE